MLMRSLVESVKPGGVNQPVPVHPRVEGGYEIIAGHRRQKASERAGHVNMPCIVRNMTDNEAALAMTDLTNEKAFIISACILYKQPLP